MNLKCSEITCFKIETTKTTVIKDHLIDGSMTKNSHSFFIQKAYSSVMLLVGGILLMLSSLHVSDGETPYCPTHVPGKREKKREREEGKRYRATREIVSG